MKTQTGGNSKRLIYEAMGKSKCLNSFRLVVLLKESGSKIQNLAVAYLTELRPYVVVLDLARLTHSHILSYTYGQMFQTEIIL